MNWVDIIYHAAQKKKMLSTVVIRIFLRQTRTTQQYLIEYQEVPIRIQYPGNNRITAEYLLINCCKYNIHRNLLHGQTDLYHLLT